MTFSTILKQALPASGLIFAYSTVSLSAVLHEFDQLTQLSRLESNTNMQRVNFGRWVLDLDVAATQKAFKNSAAGMANACLEDSRCLTCRNFIAQRTTTFNGEVQEFMKRAGISPNQEAELCYVDKPETGLYFYSGWFHFVGQIISGSDAYVPDNQIWYLDLMNFGGSLNADISSGTPNRIKSLTPTVNLSRRTGAGGFPKCSGINSGRHTRVLAVHQPA